MASRVGLALVVLLTQVGCAIEPSEGPEDTESARSTSPAESRDGPSLDAETALGLAAMPLACIDRPHALRSDRSGYLDDVTYSRRRDFDRNRAFYGCWDWHSAVNSTWAMVRLLKEKPDLAVAPLIHEKLRDHLSEDALAGELEYLTANPSFERPYGWAWLLELHAELASWDEPDAVEWAGRLDPLARQAHTRLADYFADLDRPVRRGVHQNTAFALTLSLDAASTTGTRPLVDIIEATAVRLFQDDVDCPTAYEPGPSDFLSPCLEEAGVMAMVLEPDSFVTWLNDFLPPLDSKAFANLRSPVPASGETPLPEGGAVITNDSLRAALGARSHLIGLAFTRAEAMLRIARALPPGDGRAEELRRLADEHARAGFDSMFDADYAGSHWIGTFALKYMVYAAEGTTR